MRDYYAKRPARWWRIALMALLAAVAVFASVQLVSYGVQMLRTRQLNDELSADVNTQAQLSASVAAPDADAPEGAGTIAPETEDTVPTVRLDYHTSGPQVRLALEGLLERNPDLVGWVQLDALVQLDIPVVQRDHTYYLRRDFDGNSNMNGTAFMDVHCSILPRSDNLIVYAHNMKSGEMFGGLHKLRQEVFYRAAPMATFSTLYETADYVPVAVVLCSINGGERHFNFAVTNFATEADFNAFITRARELSDVEPPYDVRWGEALLTRVTCYGDTDDQRLVVILRQVRAEEDAATLATMWK